MKKILGIIVLGLLLSGNAYAVSFTLPVLDCEWKDDYNEKQKETMDLKQIQKKMEKQGYGKIKANKDYYKFEFIRLNEMDAESLIKGSINRSTGLFKFTTSHNWDTFYAQNENVEQKIMINGEKMNREEVLSLVSGRYIGECKKTKNKNL